jgi:hypothetical protein
LLIILCTNPFAFEYFAATAVHFYYRTVFQRSQF